MSSRILIKSLFTMFSDIGSKNLGNLWKGEKGRLSHFWELFCDLDRSLCLRCLLRHAYGE
jgi:hypothetical protein